AGEVAQALEVAEMLVVAHPAPIVERLQRKAEIFTGFELYDDEASVAVEAEQIEDAAGAERDLGLDGTGSEAGIEAAGIGAEQMLHPAFGLEGIERSTGVAAGDAFAGHLVEQAVEERLRGGNKRRGLAANTKVVRGQELTGEGFARDFEAEDEDAACARGADLPGGIGAAAADMGEEFGGGGGLRFRSAGRGAAEDGGAVAVVFERRGFELARGGIEAEAGEGRMGAQPAASPGEHAARGFGEHQMNGFERGVGIARAQQFDPGKTLGEKGVVGAGGFAG